MSNSCQEEDLSQNIGMINSQLKKQINLMDVRLTNQYGKILKNIDQIRYEKFKQCLKTNTNEEILIPKCYKQVEKYAISMNRDEYNFILNQCINHIVSQKHCDTIKNVKSCIIQYQKKLISSISDQLYRIQQL